MIQQKININKTLNKDIFYDAHIVFIDTIYNLGLIKAERTLIRELLKLSSDIVTPKVTNNLKRYCTFIESPKRRVVFSMASFRMIAEKLNISFRNVVNTFSTLRNKSSSMGKIILKDSDNVNVFNPNYFNISLEPTIDDSLSITYNIKEILGNGVDYSFYDLEKTTKTKLLFERCELNRISVLM